MTPHRIIGRGTGNDSMPFLFLLQPNDDDEEEVWWPSSPTTPDTPRCPLVTIVARCPRRVLYYWQRRRQLCLF